RLFVLTVTAPVRCFRSFSASLASAARFSLSPSPARAFIRGPGTWCPLKTTPTGRPDARASGGEGRESETEQQRSKKKTMKTNKQNKTNKKTAAANATDGNTNFVSELKNRTEQLSETETAKTSETETEAEKAPQETGTVNAPVKPYVNFAERDFNRKLSV